VKFIARKYKGLGLTRGELLSAGYLGLVKACQLYDPERRQAKFGTYAWKAISYGIEREITLNSVVHVPIYSFKKRAGSERLVQRHRLLKLYRKQARRVVSLDDPSALPVAVREHALTDPHSLSESGYRVVEHHVEHKIIQEAVEVVLKYLHKREAEVIKLRFGIGYDSTYTLGEVGRIFKVTKERIRQIETRGIEKLKQENWKTFLRKYAEHLECVL
jgi:RNA polymerase primary sigma factor